MRLETVEEMHDFWRQLIIIHNCVFHEPIPDASKKKEADQVVVVKLEFKNGNGASKDNNNSHAP